MAGWINGLTELQREHISEALTEITVGIQDDPSHDYVVDVKLSGMLVPHAASSICINKA